MARAATQSLGSRALRSEELLCGAKLQKASFAVAIGFGLQSSAPLPKPPNHHRRLAEDLRALLSV